jgi:hypothetical protein
VKIKISKSKWEEAGKKAGWTKQSKTIPDDGFADGGEPYTPEEMGFIEKEEYSNKQIPHIKEEISKVVDEWDNNLLSKEGLELRLKELVGKMFLAKGKNPNQSSDAL